MREPPRAPLVARTRARGRRAPRARSSTVIDGWMSTPTCSRMRSTIGGARPRLGEVDARRRRCSSTVSPSSAARGRVDDEALGELHHVVVVGERLVGLEHRELGVVAGVDALVAEDAADLEDPLEPADDQPLEVQLERDAQVEVDVERVVVGDERPGGGARRARGCSTGVSTSTKPRSASVAPDGGDRGEADLEDPAGVLVDDQVDVALAVAGVDVGEAVPLVGQRAQRLGQQLERASTLTDSSPLRVVITVPSTPTQSPRSSSSNASCASSPITLLRHEQLDAGRSGRAWWRTSACPAGAAAGCARRPATATSVSAPGSRSPNSARSSASVRSRSKRTG